MAGLTSLALYFPCLPSRTLWPATTSMTMTQIPNLATHPTMRTGELDALYRVSHGPAEMPRWDETNAYFPPCSGSRHGTRCAGEVSATANNGFCGAGVAFNARIGGTRGEGWEWGVRLSLTSAGTPVPITDC